MTMFVKSSGAGGAAAAAAARDGGGASGGTSRKMRQVGKIENIVAITCEAAGRERSPA